ncbi:ABC transporter permease [Glaciecola siphonariae]|uniref:ABC transporter permease n=1 Tax=Glaciecola siphonariae TaxID=521012 RepID=A0ABV9LRQ8_9ALTE
MSHSEPAGPGFFNALTRELRYYRSCYGDICISLSILIGSMVVVAWIFSSATLTNLPIAVVDTDNSSLSRTYIRMLEAAPELHIAEKLNSVAEARERLEQASIYAFVVIPNDFSKQIKTGGQTTVVAWHSGQFLTISGMISKSLKVVTGTMSAGVKLTSLEKRGDSQVKAAVDFMPIKPELRTLFNPFQNYQFFLVGSVLPAMLQVFVMVWTVFVVGREYSQNTQAVWLSSGKDVFRAVAAKVLPIFIISTVIGLSCLTWLYAVQGWPIEGSVTMLFIGWLVMIASYISLGLLFVAFSPQLATALSLTVFFTAPAFAYAGITFPQLGMPYLAQLWSYILPIRTLLRLQIEQVEIAAPVTQSLPELLILVAFVVVPLPFALYRIHTRCKSNNAEEPA